MLNATQIQHGCGETPLHIVINSRIGSGAPINMPTKIGDLTSLHTKSIQVLQAPTVGPDVEIIVSE